MANFRKVIKTGNSLAITIPSKVAASFSLKEGDFAQLKVNRTKTSLTYVFTGHPRQLSLISQSKTK
jgi:antitoxin component of MazEF toxin-antitoxin module